MAWKKVNICENVQNMEKISSTKSLAFKTSVLLRKCRQTDAIEGINPLRLSKLLH